MSVASYLHTHTLSDALPRSHPQHICILCSNCNGTFYVLAGLTLQASLELSRVLVWSQLLFDKGPTATSCLKMSQFTRGRMSLPPRPPPCFSAGTHRSDMPCTVARIFSTMNRGDSLMSQRGLPDSSVMRPRSMTFLRRLVSVFIAASFLLHRAPQHSVRSRTDRYPSTPSDHSTQMSDIWVACL